MLRSPESSSTSEDMDAASEVVLNVVDLEYEDDEEDMSFDDEESSDDEQVVRRRYLRANGTGRRLPQLTETGYKCDTSCMHQYMKCRNRCKVVAKSGTTHCINGVVPVKCKKHCCQSTVREETSSQPGGDGAGGGIAYYNNGQFGTDPHIGGGVGGGLLPPWITTPQLPYCPNFTMHTTGMGPCMATQYPIPGVNACPSGTHGTYGPLGRPCVVW